MQEVQEQVTLLTAGRVSRLWYRLVATNDLWRQVILQQFGAAMATLGQPLQLLRALKLLQRQESQNPAPIEFTFVVELRSASHGVLLSKVVTS